MFKTERCSQEQCLRVLGKLLKVEVMDPLPELQREGPLPRAGGGGDHHYSSRGEEPLSRTEWIRPLPEFQKEGPLSRTEGVRLTRSTRGRVHCLRLMGGSNYKDSRGSIHCSEMEGGKTTTRVPKGGSTVQD